MKSKIGPLLLSLMLAIGLWMYVITTVSPNSKTTISNVEVFVTVHLVIISL